MASRVVLTSDSTCDLSDVLLQKYPVRLIPLYITLEGKSFRDGVDITPDDIYENYNKNQTLPKTAAISPLEYTDFFNSILNEGCEVIHFSLSSAMSSTHNNARIAASEFENVYVVDTKNLSTGSALLIIKAHEMLNEGISAAEVANSVQNMADNVNASFVINSLEFLYKGGRCSALAAIGANLLKLKPTIEVKDGVMGVGKKYRGSLNNVITEYVEARLNTSRTIDYDRIFVTHAGVSDPAILDLVIDKIKSIADFKEIHVTRARCTISSHCGIDTLGVLFMYK